MKILVIGGNGFIGSHLVERLNNAGHTVYIYDNKNNFKFKIGKVKVTIGDITNYKKLENVIKNKDVVYNFAAISDIEQSMLNPIKTITTNILGNAYILNLCVKYKVKKFIFGSTIYVHSSQGSFYRVSKQSSELLIEEFYKRFNLNYTILRFGTVYGLRSSENNGLKKIITKAIEKQRLEYSGTKKAERRFIHVIDVANASIEVIKSKYNKKNILITGKKIFKISLILKEIGKILHIQKKPVYKYIRDKGHYDVSPYSYKPKKDKKILLKSKINLTQGIQELIDEIKKNEKY